MENAKRSLPFEVDIRLNSRRITILDGIAIEHYDRRYLQCLLRYHLIPLYNATVRSAPLRIQLIGLVSTLY